MKKVILKQLTLTNFKGERSRTTQFQPNMTTISGCNGIGKSRHFEAFLWLLFGKDSQDRKDYEIKTRIDGVELHKSECSVMGVLDVDGEEITLKRAFMEDWVKPRGKTVQVFKGNRTECWWNDAPISVSEYSKRVQDIIDDCVFKMLTNPAFFANMNWKYQREQLFKMAGTISDEEIARGKPDFEALLDAISGKSLSDFKAERSAKKKRLRSELDEIQPRIDQTRKMIPDVDDFSMIEANIKAISEELKNVDIALDDERKAFDEKNKEKSEMRTNANALRTKADEILFEAQRQENLRVSELNSQRTNLAKEISSKHSEESNLINSIKILGRKQKMLQDAISDNKKSQDDLRDKWRKENALEYNGDTICPHCHQTLPQEMVSKAREMFYDVRTKKCDEISFRGKSLTESIKKDEEELASLISQMDAQKQELASIQDIIISLENQQSSLQEVFAKSIKLEDIPECKKLLVEADDLMAKANISVSFSAITIELREKKKNLLEKYTDEANKLSKRDLIEKGEKEILSLEARGKELAQQIADIEHEEFLLHEFSKARADECEHRINSLFSIVTFKLYDETLEGNPIETCIPMVDGVPYGSVNTAMQINAGLDIINALTKYYGIVAPVFLDRRESINDIIPTDAQIINLVVSDSKELLVY